MTHNTAYSLYPRLTLMDNSTLLANSRGTLLHQYVSAVKKYEFRSYKVIAEPPLLCVARLSSDLSFVSPRAIGDKYCWKIDLEYFGQQPVPSHSIEHNTWQNSFIRDQFFVDFLELNLPVIEPATPFLDSGHMLSLLQLNLNTVPADSEYSSVQSCQIVPESTIRSAAMDLTESVIQLALKDPQYKVLTPGIVVLLYQLFLSCYRSYPDLHLYFVVPYIRRSKLPGLNVWMKVYGTKPFEAWQRKRSDVFKPLSTKGVRFVAVQYPQ
ncbi:hypothetical protein GYMLUDRAFT_58413 [Collybiopsis luxurians FD-317 M1]|uniref:Uncharacterized protein n=1 Tax=Collybiopsis luxurians FD-317 M1 TaxID=944289 RepID=A0A0D0BEK5_9AGAR|nr:hypothetical protein GYMLUDRAFT_58413 [Collybiopsis luxurians FD-317 M1]